jgi:trehalose 6-phosphate phosphatase
MTPTTIDIVIQRLARAPSLLVLCEFDGTIAEYVAQPSDARPVARALETLRRLGSIPRTRAAMISGRSLQSLRAACAVDPTELAECGVGLIGSAGMEIESQMTLGLTADARRMRSLLLQGAGEIAGAHAGVTVDEKPFGVALHVRGAEPIDARGAIESMLELASTLPHKVYSQTRDLVLDLSVLPVSQDWAIDALREREHAVVFYAGNDDRALASMTPDDVSCAVGRSARAATVSVDDPASLVGLLDCIGRERARFVHATHEL